MGSGDPRWLLSASESDCPWFAAHRHATGTSLFVLNQLQCWASGCLRSWLCVLPVVIAGVCQGSSLYVAPHQELGGRGRADRFKLDQHLRLVRATATRRQALRAASSRTGQDQRRSGLSQVRRRFN